MTRSEKEAPPTSTTANGTINNPPFWNVNVPPELHTQDCPDFLQYAFTNDKDRQILSTLDADYKYMSWTEVRELINGNRLDLFIRKPSDLRRYREYCDKLVKEYGSVMAFVMQERLRWEDLTPAGKPFSDDGDIKILYNDWPYGIDPRIKHLVIWTKFDLEAAPVSSTNPVGDLTPEARQAINEFFDKTFVSVCGKDNVIWFKNWSSLKSIHAVEHFHVMLFDPDMEFVRNITNGDVPLAEKVGRPNEVEEEGRYGIPRLPFPRGQHHQLVLQPPNIRVI